MWQDTWRRSPPPYRAIGGLADAVWGVPRATRDVDVTVWVCDALIDMVVKRLAEVFRSRVDGLAEFVRRHRVLPLAHPNGVRLDVIFGLLPFAEAARGRRASVACCRAASLATVGRQGAQWTSRKIRCDR
jgi:hypothetical protein